MDDRSPPPRQVKIRPAGWVVIALVVLGLGWLAFRVASPHLGPLAERLKRTEPAPETSPSPEAPASPEPPSGPTVVPRALFPAAAPGLPSPGALPSLALPAFSALRLPAKLSPLSGERAALERLQAGEVGYAVVSVPALAASPEVVEAGARVVWSLGAAPEDAVLFPSCEPAVLRELNLGVVRGSAGHLALLAAFADEQPPAIETFDDDVSLTRALGAGLITGGARRMPPGTTSCLTLPVAATTLVVVRGAQVEADPAQLAAIAQLARRPESAESVASFLDPSHRDAGGFVDVYERSQQVWRAVGLIDRTVPASQALSSDEEAAPVLSGEGTSRWGKPSWPDGR